MNNPRGRFRGGRFHRGNRRRSAAKQPAVVRTSPPDDDDGTDKSPDSPGENADFDVNTFERNPNSQYHGWKLYFDDKEYSKDSPLVNKVEAALGFFERHRDIVSLDGLEVLTSFIVDLKNVYADEILMNEWSEFKNDIYEKPRETLNCLGLAIHQIIADLLSENVTRNCTEQLSNLPMIRVKLRNYSSFVSLRDLKVNCYGKLISTRGCVIRVGRARHLAQWFVFVCAKCGIQKVEKQPDGIYTLPKKCDICGPAKFLPKLDSPYVKTAPFQTIRLQEHFGDEPDDRGRMPRVLEVELIDDLVETYMPGDDVTVVGIIKVRGTDDGIGTIRGNTVNACSLYMEAVSIKNNKSKSQKKTDMAVELSVKDYFAIKQVHDEPDIFSLLVRSLCPNIYGHEIVKAGLLLSLFGGSSKHASLRDNIHVLMIGDPGLGKSQMLQSCSRVAARGIYVCGNSSTCSGLTVTLTKETGTSDFALEPGALVLADRGCCLIDEFDKMPTQHQALLEAMEQQSVSVAKSGVVCSLPARASILAAANPIGGRYDRSKTVVQNLNMSEPLLSRFDLVFLLLDQPNEHLDSLMCAHVMNTHIRGKKCNNVGANDAIAGTSSGRLLTKAATTLRERLSFFNTRTEDLVPQSIIRKYIAYARQYVQPKLTTAAASVLQDFYLELRKKNNIFGNIPIYNRQLEALIRLTEARAKLELRVEATAIDASEVVEILKYTLADVPLDAGTARSASTDSGKLTGNKVKSFIRLLKNEAEANNDKLFSKMDLMEIAERGGIVVHDFSRFIRKLNDEGILLKRGKQLYKFVED